MARIDPDIQEYFDFKYVEGELHIYIRQELVKALGWTDKDLDMSFGGIKRMNSFKGAHLSIHPVDKDHYQHCLLYTSPSPRDVSSSRMPSSA